MRALVIYESMFGNTRLVAEWIAGALDRAGMRATVAPAGSAPTDVGGYDLVMIGAPTHAHTLPLPASRKEAATWADNPEKALSLERSSQGTGVREWLASLGRIDSTARFAAFGTRADMPRIISGDASSGIAKRLRSCGIRVIEKECFVVSSVNVLLDGEQERAERWAAGLAVAATVPLSS